MSAKRLAVIIPAYNAEETLRACLEALAVSTRRPDEIVLFNDGSTDGTEAIAKEFGFVPSCEDQTPALRGRVLKRLLTNRGAPKGPAHARNAAADAADADILVFVDADVAIEPQAIAVLEATLMSGPSIFAAFGSYNRAPRARRLAALYVNLRHHSIHQEGAEEAATFWTGLGAVKTSVFDGVGGFDERRATSMEDIELGARLIAAGGRVRLAKGAQGAHLKDWTLAQLWKTDIFGRAIPWARLIASGQSDARQLNAGPRERLSAILAHLVWMLTIAGFLTPLPSAAALGALAAWLWLNRKLLALFFKVGGARLLVVGAMLHFLYHLYASAIFGTMLVASPAGARTIASGGRSSSLQAKDCT
ncbi:MAG: glycosyltransferase family 2 protein [Amphiplicatus sp.]